MTNPMQSDETETPTRIETQFCNTTKSATAHLSNCDNFATLPKHFLCATFVLQLDNDNHKFQQARNGSADFFSSFARRKDGKHREHQPFDGVSLLLAGESGVTNC